MLAVCFKRAGAPADVLSGEELYFIRRELCRSERRIERGPGGAGLEGARQLGLAWNERAVFAAEGSDWDLQELAPAMVKKLAAAKWKEARRTEAAAALRDRWQALDGRGEAAPVKSFGEIDLEFIHDELAPGKLAAEQCKFLAAIVQGLCPHTTG